MSALTGMGMMIRLALRRDRVVLPLWTLLPALFPVAFVTAFTTGYPTAQARQEYAETSVHNVAFTVVYGALHGSSLGELVTWRAGFIPVVVGLSALLTVIRHTRTEEEQGRRELLGATALARHAGLAAALIIAACGSAVLGLLSALLLIGQGLPAAGALAYGCRLLIAGCVFAAVGAVAAQLTTSAAAARALGIVALAGAFLLRGIGDGGGSEWPAWLSPFGWAGRLQPFGGERWWVLALPAVASAALVVLAVVLSQRRDLGGGLLPERRGPAGAASGLRSPLALAWRLHRGSLAGRTGGLALVGLALGGITESLGELMNNSTPAAREALARLGGPGTVVDQFLVGMMTLLGVVCAGFAIQTVLRLRAEESGGRAEPVLATPVDRSRWAGSHLVLALAGPAAGLVVFGAALGLAHGLGTGDLSGQLPRVLGAALIQLPAVWVFTGLAFALFGLLPRWAATALAILVASLLCGWAAEELRLSPWVTDLSVFAHLPRLPGADVTPLPLIVLTALALALAAAGWAGLRRRDIPIS
ncbi:ABC transporter permease [Nonomuraea sp. 3-1Str]|uniref:ABC transporter permease n=1 Tax=Nonomuraea sp. 3-1Str TaxID=2929801 RepID=UPI0028587468|nr:ABC transporter permease [Nonomuraea sp. 3-1Str]MDR8413712.1 ABC transporter permease [Nonomuraea sp. 3-1Str]